MEEVSNNGLTLSRTGKARQVVVFAHGDFKAPGCCGLFSGDGYTSLPHNIDQSHLFFYSPHGSSEVGFTVLQEVMLFPTQAYEGLKRRDGVPLADGEAMGPQHLPSNFEVKEAKSAHDGIRNYALYHHDKAAEKLDKHRDEKYLLPDGQTNTDVDLVIITSKKRKHLSDVFALCQPYHYERYHFAACRVRR